MKSKFKCECGSTKITLSKKDGARCKRCGKVVEVSNDKNRDKSRK